MTVATRRLRVLHVVQNLNYGGMERLIADIVRLSDAEAIEPHVMALQYLGRFAEEAGEGTELHLSAPLSKWSLLRPTLLARQIAAIRPDVVHSHSGVWYKAAVAARMAGVPRVIHTEHGRRSPDPWSDRIIDHRAARSTDVVVAVSDALAAHLHQNVVRERSRVAVIHNGVDTERYRPERQPDRLREELGLESSAPVIGSIGRFEGIKGYDIMAAAFIELSRRWDTSSPAPHLVLAGDGSEREKIEKLVAEAGLAERVHLLGWRDDVSALHAAFTLFSMSSHSEGTSVSLLEAMSSGLCPVVTDVGGNRAVLGPALSHRLVPSGDPSALAAAWMDALSNDDRRRRDAGNARNRVLQSFRLDRMVEEYERLYFGPNRPLAVSAAVRVHQSKR